MWELEEQVNWMVEQYFEDSDAIRVNAADLGLDERAGYLFISIEEEWIATNNTRPLDYYGGFEYVEQEYKAVVGAMTFYSADHSRVSDALDYYNEQQGQQREEDAEEQQRRDEKNGLYPDKWDDAN